MNKDCVVENIREFRALVERNYNGAITCLIFVDGEEYVSNSFESYLSQMVCLEKYMYLTNL